MLKLNHAPEGSSLISCPLTLVGRDLAGAHRTHRAAGETAESPAHLCALQGKETARLPDQRGQNSGLFQASTFRAPPSPTAKRQPGPAPLGIMGTPAAAREPVGCGRQHSRDRQPSVAGNAGLQAGSAGPGGGFADGPASPGEGGQRLSKSSCSSEATKRPGASPSLSWLQTRWRGHLVPSESSLEKLEEPSPLLKAASN